MAWRRRRLRRTSTRFRCRRTRARSSRPSCSRTATCSRNCRRTEREAYLHGTSYTHFLREHFDLPEAATQIFSNAPSGFWGLPAESLSVAECLQVGLPGAHVLGGPARPDTEERDSPEAMFPDGNSSIARLLVRSLIPATFRAWRPMRIRSTS